MAAPTFTLSFVNTPPYFSGTGVSSLVPSVFPVAINGRPYMVDQRSGKFIRGYEQRVRDSQDTSTAPGESAINPGGLWRRGQDSWHLGAGQKYADTAEAQDYRFYKSKGINPWVKGQISLLNDTKLSLSDSSTTTNMLVQDGRLYVSLNGDVKFTTDPYASSPTWTDCTGEPGGGAKCLSMATNGDVIYFGFENDGIRKLDPAVSVSAISGTKFINTSDNYYMLGFAKGFMFGSHDHVLHNIDSSGSKSTIVTPIDTAWRWVGVATGQNAVYAAGYANKKSLVYKVTIGSNGVLDKGVVALELPTGEVITGINAYLGYVLLGTNKGVRFCSTDTSNNLVAGSLIPTSGDVKSFAFEDKYCYFTWTNYDGISGGLGRLDLSAFTSANTPAYATDLMYTSTAQVKDVRVFPNALGVSLKTFIVQGVGVVVEDTANVVSSGTIEGGTWRWGIPDRKFVAKVDARAEPLVGSITAALSTDAGDYENLDTWTTDGEVEYTYDGSDAKAIEASIKFTLTRDSGIEGPVLTRWMARAYAAPFRSQVFSVPILLHHKIRVKDKDYYFDVEQELDTLDALISDPRIINLQIGNQKHTVILEDIEWVPADSTGNKWEWEGTATVTLRSVEN